MTVFDSAFARPFSVGRRCGDGAAADGGHWPRSAGLRRIGANAECGWMQTDILNF
jgi:hypothetical protein